MQSASLLSAGITTKSPTELEKEMATHFHLPGKSHRQRSLEGYRPWDCKSLPGGAFRASTHWGDGMTGGGGPMSGRVFLYVTVY